MDLSIIVISFNTREMTCACLRSVYEQTQGISFELIVIDNNSNDGSAEAIGREFPQARLLAEQVNHGFAAANNLAAQLALGDYLLLLNPDTVVLSGAIQKLLQFARVRSDLGIVGGRTLFGDRSLNPTSCWGRPTPWSAFCRGSGLAAMFPSSNLFNSEAMPDWKRDTFRQVDIVTGCLLMIRRALWTELGGFDPVFFMYAEEADLCLRAKKLGVKCGICPDAEIIHYGGASERVAADKMVRLFTAKSLLFSRHWRGMWPQFGIATLDLWALSRTISFAAQSPFLTSARPKFKTWSEVWGRRSAWGKNPEFQKVRSGPRPLQPLPSTPSKNAVQDRGVLNITLHGIGVPDREIESHEKEYWVRPEDFRSILDRVRDYPRLCITFDDGNMSDIRIAVPELLKRGLKGRFFVVVDRIGKPGSLGVHELKEMLAAGMEIGFHGHRHIPWRGIDREKIRQDILQGRERLQDLLGIPIVQAACPFGQYRLWSLKFLAKAGFQRVHTSDRGFADSHAWLQTRNTVTINSGAVQFDDPRLWSTFARSIHSLRVAAKRLR